MLVVQNQNQEMKFTSTLALLTLAPTVAFDNDNTPLTQNVITTTCREYCSDIINTQLPSGKCSLAHSAGSKYVSLNNPPALARVP